MKGTDLKRLLAASFFLALSATAAFGQCNPFVSSLPQSTVVGRLPGSAGPCEAIPFSNFVAALLASWSSGTGLIVAAGANPFTYINPGTGVATGLALGVNSGNGFETYAGMAAALAGGTLPGSFTTLAASGNATISGTFGVSGAASFAALGATGALTGTLVKANGPSIKASPTAPSSTSNYLMQGLAGSITPNSSGTILSTISGTVYESGGGTGAGNGALWQISYGTGAAPTANSTLAGTQIGVIQEYTTTATVTAADVQVPFSITYLVTGLTVGTAYWIDLAAKAVNNANTIGFENVAVVATEQ